MADALLFAVPFILSVILLGLTLQSLFRHRETAIQALPFTSLPAVFVAGFSWPLEAIPTGIRVLSSLVPSTAGIAGFLRINQMGATIGEVRSEWLSLWGLCLLYFLAAWWSRRNKAEGRS